MINNSSLAVVDLTPTELADLTHQLTALDQLAKLDKQGQCQLGLLLATQLKAHIQFDDESPQPALAQNDKRCSRNTFQIIASAEFFNDIAYGFFQYKATYKGLISLGLTPTSASCITGLLASADFLNNITNFSPANDANSWLFRTRTPLKSPTLQWLAAIVNTISIFGSYIPGATPGYTEMLQLLPANLALTDYVLAAVFMGMFAILPGTAYFIGFHDDSMHKSFQAFEQWLASEHKDFSWLRGVETLKKITGVVCYRALCFAFFMQNCLLALKMNGRAYQPIISTLSVLTAIATALNVVSARLLPTIAETMHSQFVHVTKSEFLQAQQDYLSRIFSSTSATAKHVSSLLANLLIAAGYALMAYASFDSVAKYFAAITIGVGLASLSLGAQREAAIYQHALAMLDKDELSRRMAIASPHLSPLINPSDGEQDLLLDQGPSCDDRLNITRANFAWLANTFKSRELFIIAALLSTLARLARIFGFYYFACQLNLALKLNLSSTVLAGLCLAFAPDNIKNEWLIFTQGTVDTVAQKIAEAYVAYGATKTEHTFIGWSLIHFWSVYNKAFLAYDLKAEVFPAMQRRVTQLSPNTSVSNTLAAFNRQTDDCPQPRLLADTALCISPSTIIDVV